MSIVRTLFLDRLMKFAQALILPSFFLLLSMPANSEAEKDRGFRSECGPGVALKQRRELLPWLNKIQEKIRQHSSFERLSQSLVNQKKEDIEVQCFFAINQKSGQLEHEHLVLKNDDGSAAQLLLELLRNVGPYFGFPNDLPIKDGLKVKLVKHRHDVQVLATLGTLSSKRRLGEEL